MTKFALAVIVVAFTVVCSASAMAEGWNFGDWEPPTKAPMVKAVSLVADWGAPAASVSPVAPHAAAGCSGMVRAEPASSRARDSGRWFPGKWIMANREGRAQARAPARMGSGHS